MNRDPWFRLGKAAFWTFVACGLAVGLALILIGALRWPE
jgi:hypothetical protein